MTNITKLANQTFQTLHNTDYSSREIQEAFQFLIKNKFLPYYLNDKKYFIFIVGNRLIQFSEFEAVVLLTISAYSTTVAIRYLLKKAQLKKRTTNLWIAIRGGSTNGDSPSPTSEEITNVNLNIINGNAIAYALRITTFVNPNDAYLVSLICKCVKPGKSYEVVDLDVLNVFSNVLPLLKGEVIRVVSREALILGLVITTNKISPYLPTAVLFSRAILNSLMQITPAAIAIIAGVAGGLSVSLPVGSIFEWIFWKNFSARLAVSLISSSAGLKTFENIRYIFGYRCSDLVRELPSITRTDITNGGYKTLPYIREEPNKIDAFVISNNDTNIYLEVDTNANAPIPWNTVNEAGELKLVSDVGGNRYVGWFRRKRKQVQQKIVTYLPLKARSKSISDFTDGDTTKNLDRAREIYQAVLLQENLLEYILPDL